jgi:hypothetical protein
MASVACLEILAILIAAGIACVVRITEPSAGVVKRPDLRSSARSAGGDHIGVGDLISVVGA